MTNTSNIGVDGRALFYALKSKVSSCVQLCSIKSKVSSRVWQMSYRVFGIYYYYYVLIVTNLYARVMGCGGAEATGLGVVCFVVLNLGLFFLLHKLSTHPPPPGFASYRRALLGSKSRGYLRLHVTTHNTAAGDEGAAGGGGLSIVTTSWFEMYE